MVFGLLAFPGMWEFPNIRDPTPRRKPCIDTRRKDSKFVETRARSTLKLSDMRTFNPTRPSSASRYPNDYNDGLPNYPPVYVEPKGGGTVEGA